MLSVYTGHYPVPLENLEVSERTGSDAFKTALSKLES
jgi:hypothetical protein